MNETAKRNVSQLMENATTYAARAREELGWGAAFPPYPSGWDAELVARSVLLQHLRICYYGSKTGLVPDAKDKFAQDGVKIVERIKGERDEERRVKGVDVDRWVEEMEGEAALEEGEREWWKEVRAGLGE